MKRRTPLSTLVGAVPGALPGPQIFGVDPRPGGAGKPQVEAFGDRRGEGSRLQLDLGIERGDFSQPGRPIGVEVGRAWIAPGVSGQAVERETEVGHGGIQWQSVSADRSLG